MIKKISAIILALVLCLSVMVVPASAAVELGSNNIAISFEWDKDSYSAGDTAVLSIYMDADDSLSLYTGSILIGLNSAVFSPDVNTQDALREGSTTAEWFNAYYTGADVATSILAATIVPKVQAKNTAEENADFDWYIKYTAGKNGSGWHDNTANTKAGFGGDGFVADEPIVTYTLTVNEDVADGTLAKAAITSGSLTASPTQTAWKYYKNPGSASTTANVASTDIDIAQTVATATVGEIVCPHANTTVTEVVTADPTCTEAGSKTVTTVCNDCGETVSEETVEITATGHDYETVVTAPTCTEAGYTTYTCACGDTYTADEVTALGHTAGEPVVENATSASCGEAGSYEEVVYCSVCKAEMSRETKTVDAVPHAYTSEVTKAPTCTEAGVMTYTCANCGDTYTEEIEATGHSYEAVVTAPTCTEQGYTTYTCACGDTYKDNYVDATGHSYTEEITVAPTYGAAGVKTFTCTCGDSYTEVIEALTLTVKHAGSQIIFKTQGGKYVGKFDVRAVAALKKAEFEAAFGTDGSNIVKAGFVFAAGSNVTAPSMDDVKAIVENGATVEGYSEYQVSKISTTLVKGAYSWTCLVKNIPDADKADSLVAVGFIAWDVDGDGAADAYAYYDGAQTVSFEALYDQYFPW